MIPKVETGQFSQVIDYKTRLQELLQVHGDVEIQYRVVSESGPAHAKEFEGRSICERSNDGTGSGARKRRGLKVNACHGDGEPAATHLN